MGVNVGIGNVGVGIESEEVCPSLKTVVIAIPTNIRNARIVTTLAQSGILSAKPRTTRKGSGPVADPQ